MTHRYGKREGFQNKEKKKCHDAGTVFQRRVDLSLHENVVGYDEVWGLVRLT